MKAKLTRLVTGGTLLLLPAVPALIATAFAPAFAQEAEMNTTMMDKRPIIHPNETKFGAYDPHGDFSSQGDIVTEALSCHGKTSTSNRFASPTATRPSVAVSY